MKAKIKQYKTQKAKRIGYYLWLLPVKKGYGIFS
ncbi:hypothetical protein [Riemerella phage vB_RanS_GDF21]